MENIAFDLVQHLELDPDFENFTVSELEDLVEYTSTLE